MLKLRRLWLISNGGKMKKQQKQEKHELKIRKDLTKIEILKMS